MSRNKGSGLHVSLKIIHAKVEFFFIYDKLISFTQNDGLVKMLYTLKSVYQYHWFDMGSMAGYLQKNSWQSFVVISITFQTKIYIFLPQITDP